MFKYKKWLLKTHKIRTFGPPPPYLGLSPKKIPYVDEEKDEESCFHWRLCLAGCEALHSTIETSDKNWFLLFCTHGPPQDHGQLQER